MTKTVGLNPKVPAQAVAVILTFLLGHWGVNLDADVAAAIATIVGFVVGVAAPAAPTITVGVEDPGDDPPLAVN